ncbi:MAG: TonB family protein [Bacteroidota bacterium]|nr:TonB family protein [Bacteroidota bacterium]
MVYRKIRTQNLDDIAFEGRNQSYGAFYLRKRYSRFLLVSIIFGLIFFAILTITPFLLFYFEKPSVPLEEIPDFIEYYGMTQPPDESMDELARLAAPPPKESETPVVVDTVSQQEQPKEIKEEEKPQPKVPSDSAGTGQGTTSDGTGPGEDTGIYTIIDVYPRYPGGDAARLYFLRTHINYPPAAFKSGIQGVVMVIFVIEKDGSVSHVDVASGIGGGCNEEAIRVTKSMPTWEPGKRNGKAVRVMVKMPILFRIPGRGK